MINIKGDVKALTKEVHRIDRHVIPVAVSRAINDTTKQINTQVRRQMSDDLGIAQKHFKRRVKHYKANRRNWKGKSWVGTKIMIPVSEVFKSGRAQQRYIKGRSLVPSNRIFNAQMPSGRKGVFMRKGKSRLPIQEVQIDLSDSATKAVSKWGPTIVKNKFRAILAGKLNELLRRKYAR